MADSFDGWVRVSMWKIFGQVKALKFTEALEARNTSNQSLGAVDFGTGLISKLGQYLDT